MARKLTKTERKNARTEILDYFVETLESGNVVPWDSCILPSARPMNPVSKTVYRSTNYFLLTLVGMVKGYEDPRFATYKQIATLGGNVRKGEKSIPVLFYTEFEDKKLPPNDDGTTAKRRVARVYRVFNIAAQTEGIELPPLPREESDATPIKRAEKLLAAVNKRGAKVTTTRGTPHYNPKTDTVGLPPLTKFTMAEHYYSVGFHEQAHATGHATRIGREAVTKRTMKFADADYSAEELVAELTAAFLCGECGIGKPIRENTAAYLAAWVKALRAEPSILFDASRDAQRAADYLLDTATVAERVMKAGETVSLSEVITEQAAKKGRATRGRVLAAA